MANLPAGGGMRLAEFNVLPPAQAEAELTVCCSSAEWARRLASARPFGSVAALQERAEQVLARMVQVEP